MEVVNESAIRIDRGTQFRARLNDDRVREYAELFVSADWPFETPCEVFFDGSEYYLVDGFHRYHAARTAGHDGIACNVRTGTLRDAIKFALSANAKHGLHRSNEDKRKAVSFALADKEWSKLSSRMIADMCGVSSPFVESLRTTTVNRLQSSEKRVGKDGRETVAKKSSPAKQPETKPAPQKDAWEDVDDEPEPETVANHETVSERAAKMRAMIKSHNAAMMRTVDDLQKIMPRNTSHKSIHQAFREIHQTIEGWK